MTKPQINIPEQEIIALCQQYHIQKLSFFGSVLTPHFRADSDIDILVEFDPAHIPTFLKLAKIQQALEGLFQNHAVDLRTPKELSRYFRQAVLDSAWTQYAAS